jgi:hypothetical protein
VGQLTKRKRKKYGFSPHKIVESDSWVMVCIDLVAPFTTMIPLKTHNLLAFTMINPDTGWFELVKDTNKSATSTQVLSHNI